jgi:hypothetical protein
MKKRMQVYWVCGTGNYRGWVQSVEAAQARVEQTLAEPVRWGSDVREPVSRTTLLAPASLCLGGRRER